MAVVVIAVGFALNFYRMRSGGPGPGVNWIPRFLRPKVNDEYERQGWQKPYDDDGNRNPDRTQL